uniref:Uncharacterized protein n=1 Tax=Ditylenchus dipsaci TaxID=166011 RepID=A0A915EHP1_9BILA
MVKLVSWRSRPSTLLVLSSTVCQRESQRESWMILQLLRDNLTLWRAHEGSDGAKEESSDSDDDSTTDKNA